jgi:hypothetical protein
MVTKSRIALSLALVLGVSSAAMASPQHRIHRAQNAWQHQVPAAAYKSFGSVPSTRQRREPAYMYIQDQDLKESDSG